MDSNEAEVVFKPRPRTCSLRCVMSLSASPRTSSRTSGWFKEAVVRSSVSCEWVRCWMSLRRSEVVVDGGSGGGVMVLSVSFCFLGGGSGDGLLLLLSVDGMIETLVSDLFSSGLVLFLPFFPIL